MRGPRAWRAGGTRCGFNEARPTTGMRVAEAELGRRNLVGLQRGPAYDRDESSSRTPCVTRWCWLQRGPAYDRDERRLRPASVRRRRGSFNEARPTTGMRAPAAPTQLVITDGLQRGPAYDRDERE